jgi:hypothetical protein
MGNKLEDVTSAEIINAAVECMQREGRSIRAEDCTIKKVQKYMPPGSGFDKHTPYPVYQWRVYFTPDTSLRAEYVLVTFLTGGLMPEYKGSR